MFKSVTFCVALLTVTSSTFGEKCILPFGSKTNWDVFWPLAFQENGTLYSTVKVDNEESVVLSSGQNAIISCGPNYLKQKQSSRTEKLNAVCNNGKFKVDSLGELDEVKDLGCDLRSIEEVIVPVLGCPEVDGKIAVQFGFVHPVDNSAHITGEACYSIKEGKTYFAHIRLGTEDFTTLEVLDKNFFRKPHPESRYKVDFMKAFRLDEFNNRLKELLKVDEVPSYRMTNYIDGNLLWNHQLAATRKLAWNYFILNYDLHNFKNLKKIINELKENVDIYIGSHGVTTVADNTGKKAPIYLDRERFPIPEIVWIIVKNGDKAVGFAILNDATLTEEEMANNSLCPSKCNAITWLQQSDSKAYMGPTNGGGVLCCEYEALKDKIPEIPEISGIKKLYI